MVSGPAARLPPRRTGFRKQEIDERLGGRLRVVIGEAGAFARLDDAVMRLVRRADDEIETDQRHMQYCGRPDRSRGKIRVQMLGDIMDRSEEHTSELQSLMRISYAVFCLKKKKTSHCEPTQVTH